MGKRMAALALIICMIAPLPGCAGPKGQAERDKGELVLAIGSEPEAGFDPCTGWGRYGSPLIQSTLLTTDADMGIVPDLATGMQVSPDGLEWVFPLRQDAFFTDGSPVTARDVAFTFETAKNSGSIVDLTALERVEAVDEHTVRFRLNKAQSSFVYTVAATGIVPSHLYSDSYGEAPVGSGPYKLAQWDKGQQVILEANEAYYGTPPLIGRVTILFLEEDTILAAAKAGQLDVAMAPAGMAGVEVPGMTLTAFASVDNRGLTLPHLPEDAGAGTGNNVTSDIAIRRALSYGIDRQRLVRDVLDGYGSPAYSECDGMPWASADAYVDYDPELAARILEEAGWLDTGDGVREKDGRKARFTLLYAAGDTVRQALCVAVQQQAAQLGIQIDLHGTSWDEIQTRMHSDAVLMGWGAQTPTETYLLYHSDNMGRDYYNPELYSSPAVDGYIDDAMSRQETQEALELWKQVQWDGETGVSTRGDCVWVWLVNVDHLYYIRDGLDVGAQKIHPHGHAWPLAANLPQWSWSDAA